MSKMSAMSRMFKPIISNTKPNEPKKEKNMHLTMDELALGLADKTGHGVETVGKVLKALAETITDSDSYAYRTWHDYHEHWRAKRTLNNSYEESGW